tara:strand:+ start:378 stop:1160 length:783 start_codon:yes stop_codon:yes gene_type:complete
MRGFPSKMACIECSLSFFYDPFKMGLVIVSLTLALIFFIILKTEKNLSFKKKLSIMYAHMFFLLFPFVFFALFQGCQTLFHNCSQWSKIISLLLITGGISLALGVFTGPILYVQKYKKKTIDSGQHWIHNFTEQESKKIKIDTPEIHIIDDAKPKAFSVKYLKAHVFVSLGLIDLLTKKEVEAVLLHELAHVKNRSSFLKYSANLLKMISPLARFTTLQYDTNKEERLADRFASTQQKTAKFLARARKKINDFYEFSVSS